jgi:hypothetical protein
MAPTCGDAASASAASSSANSDFWRAAGIFISADGVARRRRQMENAFNSDVATTYVHRRTAIRKTSIRKEEPKMRSIPFILAAFSFSAPAVAHGLGPFGGRAASGLEEAGAGLHSGIPAA